MFESIKKPLIIIFFFFLSVFFSACNKSQNSGNTVPTFVFSKSLWISLDNGLTWEVKNKGEGKANVKNLDVLSIAINPYDEKNVFIGLKKGWILETKNGGETWNFVKNFILEKVYGLAIDPKDGKTLYASAVWNGKGKIFKTEDNGETWKELYTSPAKGPIIKIQT